MPAIPLICMLFAVTAALLAIGVRHVFLNMAIIGELVEYRGWTCECQIADLIFHDLNWRVSEREVRVALFVLKVLGLVKREGPSGPHYSYVSATNLGERAYFIFKR